LPGVHPACPAFGPTAVLSSPSAQGPRSCHQKHPRHQGPSCTPATGSSFEHVYKSCNPPSTYTSQTRIIYDRVTRTYVPNQSFTVTADDSRPGSRIVSAHLITDIWTRNFRGMHLKKLCQAELIISCPSAPCPGGKAIERHQVQSTASKVLRHGYSHILGSF
jgi:hypothetical protein